MIYWFTGQPGSGKTTLAYAWAEEINALVVDGDHLRGLLPLGYDENARRQNVDRAQAIAAYTNRYSKDYAHVCVSLVSPYREQRNVLDRVEIYLTGNPGGKREHWVDDYEPPFDALVLDTDALTVEECLDSVRAFARSIPAVA